MDNAPIFIIRGASGAGKSTFAQKLRGTGNAFIFETDNFFLDLVNHHDYHFDPKLLGMAHNWNQGEVIRACRDCPDVPVIVANTFRQKWELKPYFEIAKMFNRKIFVFTLYTEHDNVHGVQDEKVKQMRLSLQPFKMEEWVNDYPVAYSLNVRMDKEMDDIAQIAHLKFIEKH